MCAEELVMFITTLAIAISRDKSEDEIDILAVTFSQLGDTLATISVKRSLTKDNPCCGDIPCKNQDSSC